MSWSRATLKEEASVITKGTTPTTLGYSVTSSGVPFLRAQNLVDGSVSVGADPLFVSNATHQALKRSKIHPKDVLISIAGTIGRASIVPDDAEEMNCNQAVAIVRTSEKIDRRFMLHWLSSADAQSQMSKSKVTGVISNLSLGQIGALQIPLPPLEEQLRIAGILDAADALRRRRREALALLDTLPGAIFAEMFGDRPDLPTAKIDDVIVNGRTGPFGSQLLKSEFVESGIPVLGIDNVVTNKFVEETPRFITQEKYKALQRYTVIPGDVLITIMGTCGRCAVVPSDVQTMVNTKHLCCLTPDKDRVDSEFLRAAFLFDDDVHRQLEQQTKGSIMSGLNMGIIKGLSIKIPNLEEQKSFAAQLRGINDLIDKTKAHYQELETLFASLQSRAFAGAL
ncbi:MULTISPECIES: restriction endonuclease subunit S [Marivita]|uniref:Restriction endonuclease subunit S n=1 Tax=Marivita cryptomonadis TaxID=505252 RepID=A0A9Q2NXJ9_9RHOB|nr:MULTISPECIES: restriction endonuclease subunit S [Marivita]MCR9168201.1 restriction endonuclease subunit S [Paracoccaceae bacterium]MBM2323034.1 restriction endonuclease subunit S [Marivita cryptomonadis]MBM2332617.1 restriction endonuclease subunit S [Marivita cryptomonadis]MBM2342200.1 restriction endonuclease subunit S [Marivita cryptomonadis]MBM2346865.1 restriction endonuclease subunit S [Marivita cryptomonadis]